MSDVGRIRIVFGYGDEPEYTIWEQKRRFLFFRRWEKWVRTFLALDDAVAHVEGVKRSYIPKSPGTVVKVIEP